jgi:GH24 family phage-related lysozyme (muramidase)
MTDLNALKAVNEDRMKTSANGRAFIEAFEGKFLHTYDDGTGVLTIGYGHTSAAGPPTVFRGQTITDAQCDTILATDLAAVEKNVERCIKAPIVQAQFDALVSFDFNTGSLAKSSIDDKINAGSPGAAMVTLLQYDHASGKQMAGLTRRRRAEILMFNGDIAGALKLAGAHAATGQTMPQAPTTSVPIDRPAPPSISHPASGSIGAFIASILNAIFRRK